MSEKHRITFDKTFKYPEVTIWMKSRKSPPKRLSNTQSQQRTGLWQDTIIENDGGGLGQVGDTGSGWGKWEIDILGQDYVIHETKLLSLGM